MLAQSHPQYGPADVFSYQALYPCLHTPHKRPFKSEIWQKPNTKIISNMEVIVLQQELNDCEVKKSPIAFYARCALLNCRVATPSESVCRNDGKL